MIARAERKHWINCKKAGQNENFKEELRGIQYVLSWSQAKIKTDLPEGLHKAGLLKDGCLVKWLRFEQKPICFYVSDSCLQDAAG